MPLSLKLPFRRARYDMNNTLPSAVSFLASEKISSDSLFEGFNVDLESTANLVKSLADYNPTVWSYMSAITKGVMRLGSGYLSSRFSP